MQSFQDVFNAWPRPSLKNFSADTGISYFHAGQMKHRRSIAVRHWPAIVKAAAARGIEGVDYEALVRIACLEKSE